mmetsp:Transcript_79165/g.139758  ORF Transcript_79165/g.139758 Transcript_79165/m.139758 type:complete len:266 (+) Transcript_79165:28-825(+)
MAEKDGAPPPEASLQSDGSYILELPDHSVKRWTQRPDGSWRKPERKRQGWIGDLETAKYVPPVTKADDKANKHDLHRPWRLWLRLLPDKLEKEKEKAEKGKWWDDQKLAFEFDTAEDFWCLQHFSKEPSCFESADYSLFESAVTPAWEDPCFKKGGRWILKIQKVKAKHLDELWLQLSMALVGEAFADICGEGVRGATLSMRRKVIKIALWLQHGKDHELVMAVGQEYRQLLTESPELKNFAALPLEFEDFSKQEITMNLQGSYQ